MGNPIGNLLAIVCFTTQRQRIIVRVLNIAAKDDIERALQTVCDDFDGTP